MKVASGPVIILRQVATINASYQLVDLSRGLIKLFQSGWKSSRSMLMLSDSSLDTSVPFSYDRSSSPQRTLSLAVVIAAAIAKFSLLSYNLHGSLVMKL